MCESRLRTSGLPTTALAIAVGLGGCGSIQGPPESQPPRLVVALVIDQLPPDLLDRYDALYTGGLRRLLDGGHRFTNAVHDHAYTETAAGHATLSTGLVPARHGVVANNWTERRGGEWTSVYAVEDAASPILGEPALEGRSPANLRAPGFADWVYALDPAGEVVSVSRKDRAAITMAGQSRGHVYWLEPAGGRFVTSSYYAETPAPWVQAFNADELPRFYADSVWTEEWPELTREHARPDTAAYESGGNFSWFPHRFVDEWLRQDQVGFNTWVAETPVIDAATLALARTAVEALALGADSVLDFLSISLSQIDIIGHAFGPYSREQLDNLLRLDRELGLFLAFLDETVGEGGWVLGLSADHGVLPMPEYLAEQGVDAGRFSRSSRDSVRAAIERTASLAEPERARALARDVASLDDVAAALVTNELLASGESPDTFASLFRNSYFEGRYTGDLGRFGVQLRLREHYLPIVTPRRTTHGSPYYYDRHVPLLFFGANVQSDVSGAAARTTDFAPTLAALAGVPTPADLDGIALLSVSP